MKLYKDVLSSAWSHTIKYPSLWIFGLFAALVFGNGGVLDRYLRYMNSIVEPASPLNVRFWTEQQWSPIVTQFNNKMMHGDASIYLFIALLVMALLIVAAMMMVSVGALITAADNRTHTFPDIFRSGLKHAAQLAALHLSAYLILAICTLALTGAVIGSGLFNTVAAAQQCIILVSTLLFIPIVLILSFVVGYAANYIVLENEHLLPAVHKAWKLLWKHWLVTLEMSIVMFVLIQAVNILVLLVCFIVAAPFLASVTAQAQVHAQLGNMLLTGGVVYIGIAILVGAILSTWQWSAWTLLFRRLQTEQHASTLVRWLKPSQK